MREYMITKDATGIDLQITGGEQPEEHIKINATSDHGVLREAEQVINDRYLRQHPFPGFYWQRGKDTWSTTDHDLK